MSNYSKAQTSTISKLNKQIEILTEKNKKLQDELATAKVDAKKIKDLQKENEALKEEVMKKNLLVHATLETACKIFSEKEKKEIRKKSGLDEKRDIKF